MEQSNSSVKKTNRVLLMGKAGVGKTSMKSIIFANSSPKKTYSIGYTHGVAYSRLRIMGNIPIDLMDCGGQDEFMEEYFFSQKEEIFTDIDVLIFVIQAHDYGNANEDEIMKENKDFQYFKKCIELLLSYSKNAKIFVLINKFDLILPKRRENVFGNLKSLLNSTSESVGFKITEIFPTSIWQVSLYSAWTKIVASFLPDYDLLNSYLKEICVSCDAEEVVLFDKTAFLALAYYSKSRTELDQERFESLSIIIKKFQINFHNLGLTFTSLFHKMRNYSSVLMPFTKDTFIIMLNKTEINSEILKLNLELTKSELEKLIY